MVSREVFFIRAANASGRSWGCAGSGCRRARPSRSRRGRCWRGGRGLIPSRARRRPHPPAFSPRWLYHGGFVAVKSSARCGEPACRNGNELRAAMTRLLARASWVWSCGVRWGPWCVGCLLPWSPRGVTAPAVAQGSGTRVLHAAPMPMSPACSPSWLGGCPGCQNVLWPLPAGPGLAGAVPVARGKPRSEAKAGQADGRDGMHEAGLLLGSCGGPVGVLLLGRWMPSPSPNAGVTPGPTGAENTGGLQEDWSRAGLHPLVFACRGGSRGPSCSALL